jgi:hypothetical protein
VAAPRDVVGTARRRVDHEYRVVGADRGGNLGRHLATDLHPTGRNELRGLAARAREPASHEFGVQPRAPHVENPGPPGSGTVEIGERILQPAMCRLVVRDMLRRRQFVEFGERLERVVDTLDARRLRRLPSARPDGLGEKAGVTETLGVTEILGDVRTEVVSRALGHVVGDVIDVGSWGVVIAHGSTLPVRSRRTTLGGHSCDNLRRILLKEDVTVADADECSIAIAKLAERLRGPDGQRAQGFDRTVSAHITDLGLLFHARLHDGVLDDITAVDAGEGPQAQVRLVMSSDDLLALAAGELSLGSAWLAGRVKVHASFPDLLRLRTML